MKQFLEYQVLAERTLLKKPERVPTNEELMLVWSALGLVGESGEVADEIKKAVFHSHKINREKIIKELGDSLWYISAIASILNINLDFVAETNIKKLIERYPNGFNSEDSINRTN